MPNGYPLQASITVNGRSVKLKFESIDRSFQEFFFSRCFGLRVNGVRIGRAIIGPLNMARVNTRQGRVSLIEIPRWTPTRAWYGRYITESRAKAVAGHLANIISTMNRAWLSGWRMKRSLS
jgi:hypothetical protein